MTVKELIERLQKMPQNENVKMQYEYDGIDIVTENIKNVKYDCYDVLLTSEDIKE